MQSQITDKVLGRLAIPVRDVVRNGMLKDVFVLAVSVGCVLDDCVLGLLKSLMRSVPPYTSTNTPVGSQDAIHGQIELALTWQTCSVPDD
jgi:hypothetical protein